MLTPDFFRPASHRECKNGTAKFIYTAFGLLFTVCMLILLVLTSCGNNSATGDITSSTNTHEVSSSSEITQATEAISEPDATSETKTTVKTERITEAETTTIPVTQAEATEADTETQTVAETEAETEPPRDEHKTVLFDFEALPQSLDWTTLPFGITNPDLRLTSNNTEEGNGLCTTLLEGTSWCQLYSINTDFGAQAADSRMNYIRVWVDNRTGGTLSLGMILRGDSDV